MQNITIGRYSDTTGAVHIHSDAAGNGISRSIERTHAGWIEGTRDDGSTWVMFLDAAGSPEVYWARRDELGGVIGDAVSLGD